MSSDRKKLMNDSSFEEQVIKLWNVSNQNQWKDRRTNTKMIRDIKIHRIKDYPYKLSFKVYPKNETVMVDTNDYRDFLIMIFTKLNRVYAPFLHINIIPNFTKMYEVRNADGTIDILSMFGEQVNKAHHFKGEGAYDITKNNINTIISRQMHAFNKMKEDYKYGMSLDYVHINLSFNIYRFVSRHFEEMTASFGGDFNIADYVWSRNEESVYWNHSNKKMSSIKVDREFIKSISPEEALADYTTGNWNELFE